MTLCSWNKKGEDANDRKPDCCEMDCKDFLWLRKRYIAIFLVC